jgi:hypothetical protein
MPFIKAASGNVLGLNIHADPQSFLSNKPTRQQPKQPRRYSASATLCDNIDPFQFSVTGMAPREMPGDKPHKGGSFISDIADPRLERVLRVELAGEISGDAIPPVLLGFPLRCADSRHRRYV